MTPSQKAKAAGFRSLKEVANLTGWTQATLIGWNKKTPELFESNLARAVEMKKAKQ